MSIIHIKRACEISDQVLEKCIENIRSFETERDVLNFLKKETEAHGCKLAFRPIIGSGKNGAVIHHKASGDKLKKGFLILDFGVKYKGYCCDMTRTIYLGKPSKKEVELYYLVLRVQEEIIKELEPGIRAFEIDGVARSLFGKYAKYFRHGLGHGVGKRIHQSPSLTPWNKRKIKKGAVLAIEPGLYFKNKLGIRIEDTFLLKDKPIILTKMKKELITIQ